MQSGVVQRDVVRSREPLRMTQYINPVMNRFGRGIASFAYFGKPTHYGCVVLDTARLPCCYVCMLSMLVYILRHLVLCVLW